MSLDPMPSVDQLLAMKAERDARPRGRLLLSSEMAAGAAAAREADDERLEKAIEHAGAKQMAALGFEVVKFSHPGRTKQTPGIPDRRYYHRARRLVLWWEAKSPTGRQRPDQRWFQEMCEACGETYVLGTDRDLFTWLVEHRIAAWTVGDLLVSLPYTDYTP
jgi:hypothetical protein